MTTLSGKLSCTHFIDEKTGLGRPSTATRSHSYQVAELKFELKSVCLQSPVKLGNGAGQAHQFYLTDLKIERLHDNLGTQCWVVTEDRSWDTTSEVCASSIDHTSLSSYAQVWGSFFSFDQLTSPFISFCRWRRVSLAAARRAAWTVNIDMEVRSVVSFLSHF